MYPVDPTTSTLVLNGAEVVVGSDEVDSAMVDDASVRACPVVAVDLAGREVGGPVVAPVIAPIVGSVVGPVIGCSPAAEVAGGTTAVEVATSTDTVEPAVSGSLTDPPHAPRITTAATSVGRRSIAASSQTGCLHDHADNRSHISWLRCVFVDDDAGCHTPARTMSVPTPSPRNLGEERSMDELTMSPAGWMTLAITMRRSLFAEIEEACARQGMPLERLLTDGIAQAVAGESQGHRCVTMCDTCRPAT
jgi:hypothetical protein